MNRFVIATSTTVMFLLATAAPALAGSEIPPPKPIKLAQVAAERVSRGLAFTGANIPLWAVVVGVLLVLGVVFLLLGRRRAASR